MKAKDGVFWWGLVSGAAMIVGAFGPWVKVLGYSVSGTDGSNDGWIILVLAVIAILLIFAASGERIASRLAASLVLVIGIAGSAVTIYDRGNLHAAIENGGALTQALASVGWGLNLAMVASISLAIQGLVYMLRPREAAERAHGSRGTET